MRLEHIVVASGNQGKIAELAAMLAPLDIAVSAAAAHQVPTFPPEDGEDYAAIARVKALHALKHTGLPSLGDDSGLEVDALDGAPGIYSARYGDLDNDAARNRYLLQQLESRLGASTHDIARRRARFVCALALALPDGRVQDFIGYSEGYILQQPQGSAGFGYDPLFFSDALGMSFGEASKAQKAQVSHRGKALQQLRAWLESAQS